jgi:hypothetical protein
MIGVLRETDGHGAGGFTAAASGQTFDVGGHCRPLLPLIFGYLDKIKGPGESNQTETKESEKKRGND